MTSTVHEIERELRPGVTPVALALLACGLILTVLAEAGLLPDTNDILIVAAACYGLAVLVWLLGKWNPVVTTWSAVLGLAIVFLLGAGPLGMPGLVVFLTIPVVLAAILLGEPEYRFQIRPTPGVKT